MKNRIVKIGTVIAGILLVIAISAGMILSSNKESLPMKLQVGNSSESETSNTKEDDTNKDSNVDLEKRNEEEKDNENSKEEVKEESKELSQGTTSVTTNNSDNSQSDGGGNSNTTTVIPEGSIESSTAVKEEPTEKYVTISITCNTILNNLDKVEESKKGIIPSNGVILATKQVKISDGDTVFDVLLSETRKQRIHMDFVESPVYKSAYIRGINNIYEFDAGDLSGWKYSVNGTFPNVGCSNYNLNDGDVIEWKYTCDLGNDL